MNTRRIRTRLDSLNCQVWAGQSGFLLPVSIQTATLSLLGSHRWSGCTACHSNSQTDRGSKTSPDSRSNKSRPDAAFFFLKGKTGVYLFILKSIVPSSTVTPLAPEYVWLLLFTFANTHYPCISTAFSLSGVFKARIYIYIFIFFTT